MPVISRKALREFWTRRPEAEQSLRRWYTLVRHATWWSFADVRAAFRSADQVGRCVVFNVGGNKYRIIAAVHFETYEDTHHAIGEVSGIEALSYLIEENGLTPRELSRATGISVATLSSVLAGRRQLTRDHVERLCAYFRVEPGLFIRPTLRGRYGVIRACPGGEHHG